MVHPRWKKLYRAEDQPIAPCYPHMEEDSAGEDDDNDDHGGGGGGGGDGGYYASSDGQQPDSGEHMAQDSPTVAGAEHQNAIVEAVPKTSVSNTSFIFNKPTFLAEVLHDIGYCKIWSTASQIEQHPMGRVVLPASPLFRWNASQYQSQPVVTETTVSAHFRLHLQPTTRPLNTMDMFLSLRLTTVREIRAI